MYVAVCWTSSPPPRTAVLGFRRKKQHEIRYQNNLQNHTNLVKWFSHLWASYRFPTLVQLFILKQVKHLCHALTFWSSVSLWSIPDDSSSTCLKSICFPSSKYKVYRPTGHCMFSTKLNSEFAVPVASECLHYWYFCLINTVTKYWYPTNAL